MDLKKSVLDGTAQFGVAGADELILARSQGKPLRAIAVIYRRSPQVFFALAESGITRPQDFIGKIIRVSPAGLPVLTPMMNHIGLSPDQYTILPRNSSDLSSFYSGEAQVSGGYLTNEVLAVQAKGYRLNIIYPDDYGVHFYADTIFANNDFIAAQPDLVLRFVRATLKGWTYAIENPNMVAPIVAKYNPKADLQHEAAQMTASIPLVNTGEDHIGWMKPEIWTGMEQVLRKQGIITAPLDVNQVYTMQFLEEAYGK